MSPEKPITLPERVETFNAVYEKIFPARKIFPIRKRLLVAPTIRPMAWVDGLLTMKRLASLRPPSVTSPKRKPRCGTTLLLFIRRFARKEPSSYCLIDVSLVISSVANLLPACGPR